MFKIGNSIIISDTYYNENMRGLTGIIIEAYPFNEFAVELDNFSGGHDCDGVCKYGRGWFLLEHQMENYKYNTIDF